MGGSAAVSCVELGLLTMSKRLHVGDEAWCANSRAATMQKCCALAPLWKERQVVHVVLRASLRCIFTRFIAWQVFLVAVTHWVPEGCPEQQTTHPQFGVHRGSLHDPGSPAFMTDRQAAQTSGGQFCTTDGASS